MNNVGKVSAGGRSYDWASWGESLAPAEGTTALAAYADQYYASNIAAVTRKLGKGTVTYIGVDSLSGEFEAAMIRGVYQRANVPVQSFDDGFTVDWRDGFWVATNFTEKPQTIPAPADAKLLVGARELDPAGVAVWQEP